MSKDLQISKEERFLDVGLILFMELKGGTTNFRYKTTVVGWKTGGAIIIDAPLFNGAYINLSTGWDCIVRYIYRGEAFGFETKVLKSINDFDFPLIYLAYPKKIARISLRKHERVQTYIPVMMEIQIEGHPEELEGHILDLSAGGCLLEFIANDNLNLKLEDNAKVSFSLPWITDQAITIQSVIRRIQTIRDNTKIGLQFINVSDDILTKISIFPKTQ